jgi:hypothetical protein
MLPRNVVCSVREWLSALTWALEVGDVQRFSSIKKAISYCGLCGAESSGSTVQRTPLSKQRNKHLQTTLIEAAKMAPRNSENLAMLYAGRREIQGGFLRRVACQVLPLNRLGEGAQALDAPVDKFRDWQEITNSIFCARPLAGLRRQMEVWFYRK